MMTKKNYTLALCLATAGMLAATTFSQAAPYAAYATQSVNVRSGPGTSYHRVDTLYGHENVMVRECQNGWCYVNHSGPDGWVSANYIHNGNYNNNGNNGYTNARVCFYKSSNYGGSEFCVEPGASRSNILANWNNSISSIRVYGGAHVRICKNTFYRGGCVSFSSNQSSLPHGYNNKASSYTTWN